MINVVDTSLFEEFVENFLNKKKPDAVKKKGTASLNKYEMLFIKIVLSNDSNGPTCKATTKKEKKNLSKSMQGYCCLILSDEFKISTP